MNDSLPRSYDYSTRISRFVLVAGTGEVRDTVARETEPWHLLLHIGSQAQQMVAHGFVKVRQGGIGLVQVFRSPSCVSTFQRAFWMMAGQTRR